MVRPNLAYVHRERIWKSFINKLDIKRSNFPLDPTKVFTFSLNIDLEEYTFSLCTLTLLLPFLVSYDLFYLRLIHNDGLQLLFIGFYNTTPIWTMRWSWSLDAWRILINPIRSWSPWFRRILYPLIFRNKSLLDRN